MTAEGVSGQVADQVRRPWVTGQTEIVLAPVVFLRRVAALMPPPRQHQTRYHGVLAAHAGLRAAITALVPGRPGPSARPPHAHGHQPDEPAAARPSRLPWAELFRRVCREDLLVGPRCTGPMRVLAAITEPAVVDAILTHLGLPTEPPAAAARAPPLLALWPGALDPSPDLDVFDPPDPAAAPPTASQAPGPPAGARTVVVPCGG